MARTEGNWHKGLGFISPSENVPVLLKNDYLNFGGSLIGASGYGFRDNEGTIQFKNVGGEWQSIGTGGGTGTIADNSVTFAKMQDIATGHFIGRHTAGSGDPEQVSASQARDILGLGAVATSNDYNDLTNKPDLTALNDTVVEANLAAFPATGELDKVYIAEDTGYMYRWNGSGYTQLTDQTAIWGQISGLLANQTDLLTELNTRDTNNRNRSNHTGTQLASTISNFATTVRATVLTGLSTATSTAVTAADTILVAIGKLQAQLNLKAPTASPTLTGTTTTDALIYDTAAGTVSALGNLGATEVIDWSSATHFTGTLDEACAITHSNETAGQKITIALTGEFAPTFSDVDLWGGGTAPAAPGAGETLLVTLIRLGTTVYGSFEIFS